MLVAAGVHMRVVVAGGGFVVISTNEHWMHVRIPVEPADTTKNTATIRSITTCSSRRVGAHAAHGGNCYILCAESSEAALRRDALPASEDTVEQPSNATPSG